MGVLSIPRPFNTFEKDQISHVEKLALISKHQKASAPILILVPYILSTLTLLCNILLFYGCKSNRKAMNRNWSNQKANPALKTKAGKTKIDIFRIKSVKNVIFIHIMAPLPPCFIFVSEQTI